MFADLWKLINTTFFRDITCTSMLDIPYFFKNSTERNIKFEQKRLNKLFSFLMNN